VGYLTGASLSGGDLSRDLPSNRGNPPDAIFRFMTQAEI